MTVMCCGSRTWRNRAIVMARLMQLGRDTLIIHGGARGADSVCASVARELGMRVQAVPVSDADWKRLGPAAGPIRNRALLAMNPVLVLAFWDGRTTGTADAIAQSRRRKIPVEIFDEALSQPSLFSSAGQV